MTSIASTPQIRQSRLQSPQYDAAEKLHQFDLHGCFVFDDFSPISCPPRKGIIATLVFLASREHIFNVIKSDVPTSLTFPSFPPLESTTIPDTESSIFVIPLILPPELLFETSSEDLKYAKTMHEPVLGELEQIAREMIKRRSTWIKTVSKSIDDFIQHRNRPTGVAILKDSLLSLVSDLPGGEGSTDEGNSSREEFESEVGHYKEFLESVSDLTESLDKRVTTKKWLEDVVWLLHALETTGCLGVVLIGLAPNETGVLSNDPLPRVDVASYLPQTVRTELRMPAVFTQQAFHEYEQIISLYNRPAVDRAVITPVPLQPGDHIYREIREKGAFKYIKHHGIYTGNGRVIHFAGNESTFSGLFFGHKKAKIRSTSIIRFMKQGSRLKIRCYSKCDPPSIVIQRAEDALAEQGFEEYSLFRNNCEHFCSYCKTGKGRSKQVEATKKGVTYAVAGATTAAVVAALVLSKKR